jgi:hypothetical protein
MKKTIGRFDYRIYKMGGKDRLPFNPIVQIILDNWSSDEHNGTPIISPHLMTASEIDHYVTALKKDLDAVRVTAKAALTLAKAETRAIVSSRRR